VESGSAEAVDHQLDETKIEDLSVSFSFIVLHR
jgi:hypothetical protein